MSADELSKYRKEIAEIDDEVINLLIKRFELTDEVGRIKKLNGIPIENKDVERQIVARLSDKFDDSQRKELIAKIYSEIFTCSKDRQRKI